MTRLVSRLLGQDLVRASRAVPTCVLVAVTSEETRAASDATAAALRRRGIAAEVAPAADKFGKQIRYADRRGIPFVWFPSDEPGGGEVKDIRSGDQVAARDDTWEPPADDLRPRLLDGPPA